MTLHSRRKGASRVVKIIGALALLGTVIGAVHFSDIGFLSSATGEAPCWHEVRHDNRTFDSEEELRDYASDIGVEIPDNITFKIKNGTLHQECQYVGGAGG